MKRRSNMWERDQVFQMGKNLIIRFRESGEDDRRGDLNGPEIYSNI